MSSVSGVSVNTWFNHVGVILENPSSVGSLKAGPV